jgi:hypothetical protein
LQYAAEPGALRLQLDEQSVKQSFDAEACEGVARRAVHAPVATLTSAPRRLIGADGRWAHADWTMSARHVSRAAIVTFNWHTA